MLIRHLELLLKIAGAVATVDVVAEHEYELEGKRLAKSFHPRGQFVLRHLARAHVADGGEANGARLAGKRQLRLAAQRQRRADRRKHQAADKAAGPNHLSPGMASGMKSTIMFVLSSWITSARPTIRYASSAGSAGRRRRRVGGIVVCGMSSG